MAGFATIKHGADLIAENAQTAYDDWRENRFADALATADQIVEDCQTMLRQATRLRDDLRAMDAAPARDVPEESYFRVDR